MKKYICVESLTTYTHDIVNGVNILKPVKVDIITETPMTTEKALHIISLYCGSIAPAGLWFDKKNRLESCRITFDAQEYNGVTTMKSIEIKKA